MKSTCDFWSIVANFSTRRSLFFVSPGTNRPRMGNEASYQMGMSTNFDAEEVKRLQKRFKKLDLVSFDANFFFEDYICSALTLRLTVHCTNSYFLVT